ncbi:MAG: S49 family peptidase, partial [Planctomycetaceae bacterium]
MHQSRWVARSGSTIRQHGTIRQHADVRLLATGQIYTANQAIENHMVDQIGYVEDAVEDMARSLQLSSYDAFEYRSTPGLIDLVLGAETSPPKSLSDQILQASVP